MRLVIATILCLAAAPVSSEITNMQQARDMADSLLADVGITDPFDLEARRLDVLDSRHNACVDLHYRDPEAAILTQVCFDLFMELGFPD